MSSTNEVLIVIGIPLAAGIVAGGVSLLRSTRSRIWMTTFAGTWLLSLLLAFAIGLALDNNYASTIGPVDIPASVILPAVEFFVAPLVASVVGIVVAIIVDRRGQ